MGREFELKYRADPEKLDTIRQKFSGFTSFTMVTAYYDTPDRALGAGKQTLRRRLENGCPVVTLKTNLPDGSRGEWETNAPTVEAGLAALKAQDQLRQFVVLSFGTNGQAFPGQLEEILSAIGPDRIVALVSPYGDRYWMAEARQQVIAAVENNANVYGADWCSRALADPTLVGADGIHPSATGIDAYIASIMDAFTQWSNDEKVVPAVCG